MRSIYEESKQSIGIGGMSGTLNSARIEPLFKTMAEPSAEVVGQLIDLKCGHTHRPTDTESVMFTVHLEEAGFMKGKGSIGSPQRVLPSSVSPSQHSNQTGSSAAKLSNTIGSKRNKQRNSNYSSAE